MLPATSLVSDSASLQAVVFPDDARLLTLLEIPAVGSMGPSPPKPPPTETIAIIVQNSLYASVSAQVTQYRQDLNNSGYNTILYTSPIITHQQLKGNLTQWYTSNGLVGAVIVGRLPYAQYYHPASGSFGAETFICDLYLMDLDGSWWDINPADGIYDRHNATTPADIYPEIFVSRIDPQCLSWGGGAAANINTYLSRLHSYRIGGVVRQRRALVYIDDDWTGYWGTRWDGDVGQAYPTRTLVDLPVTWTNATDWRTNRLTQNYQWTHICVHSDPTTHYFGAGGGGAEGTVTAAQVRAVPPAFSFYNLFACSGARWVAADNIAVTYVWSGNYGLAAVGSTKTGGMMDCDYFYGRLSQNATLGESLAYWFSNSLNTWSSAGSQFLEWYYGMNIVGDPFLTTYYDCTALPPAISSSTHPSSSLWYANARPQFNWTVPRDVNGIVGYYYVIDQNPSSVPSSSWGTYTTTNGTQPVSTLTDGTWYLHVVSKDAVGNVGTTAAHYQVNIDTTGPITFFSSPFDRYNSSTNVVSVVWAGMDFASGYASSQVWVDTASNIVYTGPQQNCTVTSLTEGLHIINATTWDSSGNRGSSQITIRVDLTNPTGNIISPANGAATASSFALVWSASDGQSGYYRTEVRVDGVIRATVNAPATSTTLSGLALGAHTINVTIYDWAGRSTSDQISIQVNTTAPPPIPGFPWEALAMGLIVAVLAVLTVRRRQR